MSILELSHIKKTISLLVVSIVLILISLVVGTTDNLPMIIMLFIGIVLFLVAALRYWRNAYYFAFLIILCLLVFIAEWFLKGNLTEDIAMISGFICVAGIVAGIVGVLLFSKRGKS